MDYSTFVPNPILQSAVACYWIAEGDETDWQKVAPDGCPEMIFHFADPYVIRDGDAEVLQRAALAAGQLDRPIFVRPTGRSGVFGIKFKPSGMWKLTGCDMRILYNETVALANVWDKDTEGVIDDLRRAGGTNSRLQIIETFLLANYTTQRTSVVDDMTAYIIQRRGQEPVTSVCDAFRISSRKAERLFNTQVGVSMKMYSRIVRFNYVFKLLQQPSLTTAEATYLSGYFDQAHFNREFRQFTGENPEQYFRQEHTFSNFFLNR